MSRFFIYIYVVGLFLGNGVRANNFETRSAVGKPIVVNIDAVPITLEPPKLRDTIANWVLQLLANRLVQTERSGLLRGDLAKSWKIESDGKRYVFELRQDIFFSDGSPVTANDIATCLNEAVKNIKSGNLTFYTRSIERVSALDTHRLEILLKSRMDGLLQVLGEATFSIFKRSNSGILYSGDFILKELTGEHLDLERRSDGQVFRLVAMPFEKAKKDFENKKLDLLRTYGITHVAHALGLPNQRLIMNDERSYYLALNSQSLLFKQKKRRTAFLKALNVDGIKKYLNSLGIKYVSSFLAPSFSMGRRALAENEVAVSGKSNERLDSVNPTIISIDSHELEPLLETALKGVKYHHLALPKHTFLDRVNKGEYDALIIGYGTTLRDLDAISLFFHSQSLHNFAKVKNNKIDEDLEAAWSNNDPELRIKTFSGILQRNIEDGYYATFTHIPLIFALNDKIVYGPAAKTSPQDFLLTAPFLDLSKIARRK
jgi:oligopeptide transport system substrate-binding protein